MGPSETPCCLRYIFHVVNVVFIFTWSQMNMQVQMVKLQMFPGSKLNMTCVINSQYSVLEQLKDTDRKLTNSRTHALVCCLPLQVDGFIRSFATERNFCYLLNQMRSQCQKFPCHIYLMNWVTKNKMYTEKRKRKTFIYNAMDLSFVRNPLSLSKLIVFSPPPDIISYSCWLAANHSHKSNSWIVP